MKGKPAKLEVRYQEALQLVAQLQARVDELETWNAKLTYEMQCLLRARFGSKSEQLDPRQMELLLGLKPTEPPAEDDAPSAPTQASRRRSRRRAPRLPEDLPTEEHILDPEEVEDSPDDFEKIGEEVTQELGYVAPLYFRRLFIRRKYVRKADRAQPPLIADLPPRLIPGSYASPELLTDITIKKYNDHLPLYRQEQILRTRYGIELSRKTMCDWVERVAWWLKPIYNHIRDQLRCSDYLQIDESPIRYCQAEGGGSAQGYVWVYHRPGGDVLFEWHTGRGADCLKEMLDDFGGTVQSDGYSAYQSYARIRAKQIAQGASKAPIELAACWAHARRKFYDAQEESPTQAGWMLRHIQNLYAIEKRLREQQLGPDYRAAVRTAQSAMIVVRIKKMLQMKLSAHRPTSQMGKAIGYTLSLWPQLTRFLQDGRLEIDTNLVENAIRPTAVGKKNWLFIGAPDAGERAAIIYTLLENCKREGINAQEYLLDVLRRLPSMTNQQTEQLTPANWAAQRKAQAA